MFQLIQPSGYFQRTLFFSPKSLCLFAQCAHWTQSGPHRSTRDWRPGLGLEIHMQGLWQEPPGKRMIDVQLDTCSSTGGASKTWVLTAWRSLPLPAYYEALGMLQRNGVCYVHGTWGYHPTAQGTAFLEAKMGINHVDHAQQDLETTESLTSKMSTMEVARKLWCFTDSTSG